MIFNKHYELEGQHAFLSASKYHWINYDDKKLEEFFNSYLAIQRGTKLHAIAKELIEMNINLPKRKKTLNMYVNDAIGYGMTPEQGLYYSDNCFGTADAISFSQKFLRIHDLKTGSTPASMHQLEIYAALFCLEYEVNPKDIDTELRIYQSNEVFYSNPSYSDLMPIIDKIIAFDRRIEELKQGV